AAGSTMLKLILNTADFYPELERKAKKLEEGIRNNLKETGIKAVLNRVGSMMTLFFTNEEKVSSYEEAMSADTARYAEYFKMSLESGMYIAPSQFECLFVSYAHTDEDIDNIINANLNALKQLV
ncbi:MAG TPA: aspartate aminotransferase family protein, partial [Draconibacterium sp.]|nr:aspartate aminotransferase family protein [Draconibacterium sp.]